MITKIVNFALMQWRQKKIQVAKHDMTSAKFYKWFHWPYNMVSDFHCHHEEA